MMFDMYEKGGSSCSIRNYLNENDIPTKRGGEWTSKTVSDIIRNPMYKGPQDNISNSLCLTRILAPTVPAPIN